MINCYIISQHPIWCTRCLMITRNEFLYFDNYNDNFCEFVTLINRLIDGGFQLAQLVKSLIVI